MYPNALWRSEAERDTWYRNMAELERRKAAEAARIEAHRAKQRAAGKVWNYQARKWEVRG